MKAYTLRLEDELISTLKQVSLKEKKSLRAIIIEAIQAKIFSRASKSENFKEQRLMERAARLASRLKDEDIIASIREGPSTMKVYDSSAIYKVISLGGWAHLSAQHTSSLAFFELGSIVWKNSVLTNVYSKEEAIELLDVCEIVLDKMHISYADFKDIYKIAENCHISFYDASYICLAKELKCPFVTLDYKLALKTKSVVDVLTLEEILK